jgi:hypothetical protein
VHFSTTPRILVLTSGLNMASIGLGHVGSHQLKSRAWYGQATMQYLQPMQRG